MSKKKKLIPELRFPEFEKREEWEEKSLDKVVNDFIVPMRDKPKNLDGEIPWCRIEDFNGMYLSGSKSNQGVSLETIKGMNLKVYPVNTLLVSCSADLGRCAITQKPLVTNQTFIGLVPNEKKVNTVYLYYVMTNSRNELNAKSSGTTISYLSRQEFEKFEITLPNLKEQQKIAFCLSSLDDLITAHNQKLDLLKDHKKGLMQNLFPQEGEKVPKYRFKEFEKDGNWVEKSLIDTADKKVKWSFTGGPFGSNLKASDYTSEGIRIIQLQNIGDGEFNDEYKIYTSEEKANELLSCNIYAGEIILSKMGDPVGRACIIPDNLKRCVMASDGIRLVVNETKYSKYFVYSLINSRPIREAIENKATGSTRKRIGLDELRNIELIMPKSLSEQIKIANCISSLDKNIVAQELKIEQLKQHKKGLMQGLFPKVID